MVTIENHRIPNRLHPHGGRLDDAIASLHQQLIEVVQSAADWTLKESVVELLRVFFRELNCKHHGKIVIERDSVYVSATGETEMHSFTPGSESIFTRMAPSRAQEASHVLGADLNRRVISWRSLLDLRIQTTWDQSLNLTDLVWMDDKLVQVQHAANICQDISADKAKLSNDFGQREEIEGKKVLHLPIFASCNEGTVPAEQRISDCKHVLLAATRGIYDYPYPRGDAGVAFGPRTARVRNALADVDALDPAVAASPQGYVFDDAFMSTGHGIVIKPRHAHDGIGVSIWQKDVLSKCARDDIDNVLEGSCVPFMDHAESPISPSKASPLTGIPRSRAIQSLQTAIRECGRVRDETWQKECWQLSEVPQGVLCQPLYRTQFPERPSKSKPEARHDGLVIEADAKGAASPPGMCDAYDSRIDEDQGTADSVFADLAARFINTKPKHDICLEMKVHVMFGKVVGATLKAHPWEVWIDHHGRIYIWSVSDLRRLSNTKKRIHRHLNHFRLVPRGSDEDTATPETNGLVRVLHDALDRDWEDLIKPVSIRLSEGLDELRVDWLLGDPVWKTRIGEITYQGAAFFSNPFFSDMMGSAHLVASHKHMGQSF